MSAGYQIKRLPFELTMAWSLSLLTQVARPLFGEAAWQAQPIPFFRHSAQGAPPIDLPFFRIELQQLIPSDDGALRLPIQYATDQQRSRPNLTVLDISILDPRILVEAYVEDHLMAVVAGPWALPGAAANFRAFRVPAGSPLVITARAIGTHAIEEAIIFVRVNFGQPPRPV